MREMDANLGESNTLINTMQKRIYKNKIILYSVVGLIALAIFLIIFSYF